MKIKRKEYQATQAENQQLRRMLRTRFQWKAQLTQEMSETILDVSFEQLYYMHRFGGYGEDEPIQYVNGPTTIVITSCEQ